MKRVLLLDTETTGLEDTDRCIEVAVALYDLDHAAVVASYSSLIESPSNPAEAINRIPAAMIQNVEGDPWRVVALFASRAEAVIAHRAEFDRRFVPSHIAADKPWICSKFHVEWPLGKVGDGLVHLALAHGIGVCSAHRAYTDVDTLARLLTRVHEMGHPLPAMLERALRPRVKVQALTSYDEREVTKAHGFQWDGATKIWSREMFVEDVAKLPFQTREM